MKRIVLVLVSSLALSAVVGCSSKGGDGVNAFGADPDFDAVAINLETPNGTFDSSNAASVFSQFSTQFANASIVDVADAANVGAEYLSQGDDTASSSSCGDIQSGNPGGSCACPKGGSFAYDFSDLASAEQAPGSTLDATLRVAMNACVTDAGTLDGTEFFRVHATRADGLSFSIPTAESMLVVINGTLTATDATVTPLAIEGIFQGGGPVQIGVQLDGKWVVVQSQGSTGTGNTSFSVEDKNGFSTCTVENGAGTCSGDNGAITFAASGAAS